MRPLTPPQIRELKRLLEHPQQVSGKARARVQNNLVHFGYAAFVDDDGYELPPPRRWEKQMCVITVAGYDRLKAIEESDR